jgi:6-pyruvoyltetrahydropterin/6-carboxytetrahydropterin synthase
MGPTSMSPDELYRLKHPIIYQTITRKGTFDSAHRVMNEKMKCYNLHGHTYLYELQFSFNQMENIGYAIDFKEIKRVGCQWIDDKLDHGTILNPYDQHVFLACEATKSKMWHMSLNGAGNYCNPSVENIAKEIFLAVGFLLNNKYLKLQKVRLYETPNCFTDCFMDSITNEEKENFMKFHLSDLEKYKQDLGTVEYDDRKI